MPITKQRYEETLGKFVVPTLCVGCASCAVVCPFHCLEYINGRPNLVKECTSCGICAQVCPRWNVSVPVLERFVFGRERKKDEEFGICRSIVVAQTKKQDVLKVCQDGGVATTLLLFALENGIIDGAALSRISEEEPLKAIPRLATTTNDILDCAGTRYTYSPNMLAVREGVSQRKKSLAFVGTPCQINAVRKIQMIPLKKYAEVINFTIGLFCSECFTYEGLVNNMIRDTLGIDPREVQKINIKRKMLITKKNGQTHAVSLRETKKYADKCTSSCRDFSAEMADISMGGLGLNDWTLTVIRTSRGEDLFRGAESRGLVRAKPINEERQALDLLMKLSRKKRENLA